MTVAKRELARVDDSFMQDGPFIDAYKYFVSRAHQYAKNEQKTSVNWEEVNPQEPERSSNLYIRSLLLLGV